MKKLLLIILPLSIVSCQDKVSPPISRKPHKMVERNQSSNLDTSGLLIKINSVEEEKLDSLKIRDRVQYARKTLKMYSFCNCLYQVFYNDSVFQSIDNSNGFVSRELVLHPQDVLDTMMGIVHKYIYPVDSRKNVSLLCLSFYESIYLDSIVNKFDSRIRLKDF